MPAVEPCTMEAELIPSQFPIQSMLTSLSKTNCVQWLPPSKIVLLGSRILFVFFLVSMASSVWAQSKPDLERYEKEIKPLLVEACFDCHSGKDVEGNFHADELNPDLVGSKDIAWWLEVYSQISKNDMPPDSRDLSEADRALIVDWLSAEIQTSEKLRKANGSHSPFRRLTRYEYNYALQDLLGVPWTFASDLPIESSEDGAFENNSASLRMSVQQVETYHELALKALERVTVRGERPPELFWSIPMRAAFEKEKKLNARELKAETRKFEGKPDTQAKQIERLEKQFLPPADRSHYLNAETGDRARAYWHYRKANYAVEPSDTFKPMPEPGTHFAVVQPGSKQGLTVELGDRVPDQGMLRVRIRASRDEGASQLVPSLQLSFGFKATDQGAAIQRVSQQDVPINAPFGAAEIYVWEIALSEIEHRNTYRGEMNLGDQPSPSEYIRVTNSVQGGGASEDSAILIDYVEVTTPVYDHWPPQSHQNLFFNKGEVTDEAAYAKEIIEAFMSRAWRRTPTPDEVDRKLKLFQRLRPISDDFQEAVLEVLATILTSPKFLYVLPGENESSQASGNIALSQNELATRLSLFLWCSLPDQTLLELASEGRLGDRQVLEEQAHRMLADPRAERFSKHFVQQWLKMRPLEFLSPINSGRGLDTALLDSMKQEPIAMFSEMRKRNSSVLDFIASDYLVVNQRLAIHYGIPNVVGNHFRRVEVPDNLNRGGVLTQAGLLMMNSDDEDSHPVKRGVWLLTNLLNDPPPPPPPAVPEIDLSDPGIAKLTLKERIENHRNHAACISCHQKIDPWGIAFENFDALGNWRDKIDDKVVDASSVLPDKVGLNGIAGLKKHLLEDRQEQFVRATVENMAKYALGRELGFGERAAITELTEKVRESGDGLETLVICLVTSELFRTK